MYNKVIQTINLIINRPINKKIIDHAKQKTEEDEQHVNNVALDIGYLHTKRNNQYFVLIGRRTSNLKLVHSRL